MYKVIIADDSELLRTHVTQLVHRRIGPVEVVETDTVENTVAMLDTVQPDLLLLDLKFPDGMGYQVLEYLSHVEPRPYVIVLTNYAGDLERERCIALGADQFFDKTQEFEAAGETLQGLRFEFPAEQSIGGIPDETDKNEIR